MACRCKRRSSSRVPARHNAEPWNVYSADPWPRARRCRSARVRQRPSGRSRDGPPAPAGGVRCQPALSRGFDWPGITIANGLFARFGVGAWRFDAAAYRSAATNAGSKLKGSAPVGAGFQRGSVDELRAVVTSTRTIGPLSLQGTSDRFVAVVAQRGAGYPTGPTSTMLSAMCRCEAELQSFAH